MAVVVGEFDPEEALGVGSSAGGADSGAAVAVGAHGVVRSPARLRQQLLLVVLDVLFKVFLHGSLHPPESHPH